MAKFQGIKIRENAMVYILEIISLADFRHLGLLCARARRVPQPHSDEKAQNVQKWELFKGTDILIQQFIEPNCD